MAIAPDGRHALSASWDRTLKVWDLETGKFIATFTCDVAVNCCALANYRTVLADDQVGRVHLLALECPPPR